MYEREVLKDRLQGHSQPAAPTHLAEQLLHGALVDDNHRNVHSLLYLLHPCKYACIHEGV